MWVSVLDLGGIISLIFATKEIQSKILLPKNGR